MPFSAEISSMCDTVNVVGGIRHFTVTTFVSMDGATLLHWHRKVGLWLPPGGHVEPNEDPVQAARREALEETGLEVEILPTTEMFRYNDPPQVAPPATIMVEPIRSFGGEDAHYHIDSIYFSRPIRELRPEPPSEAWRWVSRQELEDDAPMTLAGVSAHVSEDVRVLGMAAIDHIAKHEEQSA
ncbi:MAG: NUDIX domain-containing protein [Chloroflexi bacterium]|nr:NUDIX domain-containing protein [Chloroflexota bacterium]MYF21819.1 NUDIX domain-containing protein [Chloroflexota bacterium]